MSDRKSTSIARVIWIALAVIALVRTATAEIVIDDFTTSGSVVEGSPIETLNQENAALDGTAYRWVNIFGPCGSRDPQPCPEIFADIGPSSLRMTMSNLHSAEDRRLYSAFVLAYQLPTDVDLTEGGVNDAVRIDFTHSRGPTPFQNLQFSVHSPRVLTQLNTPFPITEHPFSVYLPKADFRTRGNEFVPDAFEQVNSLEFSFQSQGNGLFGPQGEDLGWELGVRRVSIAKIPTEFALCDFDADFDCDGADLNMLYAEFGTDDSVFDLDGSGGVNDSDTARWLDLASEGSNPAKISADHRFTYGDINFDGAIDSTDLGSVLNRFNETGSVRYQDGDLNGDNRIDQADLGRLLNNFGQTPRIDSLTIVPEPSDLSLIILIVAALATARRRSRV